MNSLPESSVSASRSFSLGTLAAGQSAGGGRYLLKKILGHGGMGVVWLAHDKLLREPVALKFLPPQICFDPAALEALRQETLRARRLSHPHIIRIHDLNDVANELTFISMEYVDGPNLHVLRAHRPGRVLTWRFLAPLVKQLCLALDYAHGERVIHRDLKPANLMLESSGRLKLADFGLARVITNSISRLSGQGHTSGTIGYMSPQQADGRKPQVTDDLYSLGATLYELLTSTPPFHSGDVSYQVHHIKPDLMDQRLEELELNNEIPAEVSAMIMACLAKEPEQRPQDAKAILDWLEAAEISGPPANPQKGFHSFAPSDSREAPAPEPALSLSSAPDRAADDLMPVEKATTELTPPRSRKGLVLVGLGLVFVLTLAVAGWHFAFTPPAQRTESPSPTLSASPRPNAKAAQPAIPSDGFESLFNGRDLSGWDGDTNFWSVREGAIFAATSEEGITRRENTCLIWRDPVDDFELHLKFRMSDVISAKPANSGVLYRSRRVENPRHRWQVRGYQADLFGDFTGTLFLLEDTLQDLRVEWGRSARLQLAKGETVVKLTGAMTSASQLKNLIKKNDWNELVILAQGNRLVHKINGVVTADVVEEGSSNQSSTGCLALELKRATAVQFKDIRLKRLSGSAFARQQVTPRLH